MELGLKRDEVRIVDFNKSWKDEFNIRSKEISKALDMKSTRIEHIGSTSIMNIKAKPIIDMALGLDNLEELDREMLENLEEIGYLELRVDIEDERVFAKFTDNTYEIKTHYLHIMKYEDKLWKDLIFFRDRLNRDKDLRNEYENIKKDYIKEKSNGIKEYTDFKEEFLNRVLQMRRI